jgi:hypothetical protein
MNDHVVLVYDDEKSMNETKLKDDLGKQDQYCYTNKSQQNEFITFPTEIVLEVNKIENIF